MTEAEWLSCAVPEAMIRFVTKYTSRRKERLFAVACCRRAGDLLDDYSRELLTRVESLADRPLTPAAHDELLDDAMARADGLSYRMGTPFGCARWEVANAIWDAADRDNAIGAANEIANAVESVTSDPATFDVTRPGPPKAGDAAERGAQAAILRDIIGNPFRPCAVSDEWRTGTVLTLARQMYESRDFSPMPILADALQEAGCDDAQILDHCRGDGPHVRGCWAVDAILGKM